MQRWTFPSFRLPTGTTNSQPKSIHPKPTHHTQVEAQTHPRNNSQAYNPSPKHTRIERTLRSRITKQKAQNEQLRKNIATLEAQSTYLRRLKELEKEFEQLRKEGRELARREEEVKHVVERGEEEVEGFRAEEENNSWIRVGDGDDEGDDEAMKRGRTSDEVSSGFGEGSVEREEDDLEEWYRKMLLASLLSEAEETRSIGGDEDEEKREVKQEVEVEAKDIMDKLIEEIELSSGAEAWK